MRVIIKKIIILCLSLLLSAQIVWGERTAPREEKEVIPEMLCLGHTLMGIEFAIMGGMASIIKGGIGIPTTTMDAHKTVLLNLMREGRVHISSATVPERYEAYYGTGVFAGKGPVPLRAMFLFSDGGFNWVTMANSGIKSIADLKGKRIITVGTSVVTKYVAELYFSEYGFSSKDVKWIDCPTSKTLFINLGDGIGDVVVFPSVPPAPTFSEPDFRYNLRWISTPEEAIDRMIDRGIPGLTKGYREPGHYRGDPNGSYYVGVSNVATCRSSLPEDLVYKICKMVWDTKNEEVKGFHPALKRFLRLDQTLNTKVLGACPFHSGAIKYYKEIGAWTSEFEALNKKLLADMGYKK